jgi:hypothetical protein
MLRRSWQQALVGVACACAAPHLARAQATTVASTSVLVFPRVIVNATWETTIQISNDANRPAYAHCYYVNGALTAARRPVSPGRLPPLPVIGLAPGS